MLRFTSKLSESLLWPLEKKAYAHFGIDCWKINAVPFHITSNSRIAAQYAKIAYAAYKGAPMTFLELGGGSGKFAYLFISELLKMGVSFRYILTDFAEKNLAFWNAHPQFLSWIEQGLLQTALYDPFTSDPLPFAPDFVIANYLFDTIPQDLYRADAGQLFEARVSLEVDKEGASWDDPEILSKIQDSYAFEPIETASYPDLPEAADILNEYRQRSIGTFFLPTSAFRLIRSLKQFCKPGFLLFAADRGPWTEEQLRLQPPPQLSRHKTFSFPVNFHAIGRFVELCGGASAFPAVSSPAFGAGLFSLQPIEFAVKDAIEKLRFGSLETTGSNCGQLLDRLDEANWDATLFFSFFDRLENGVGEEKERLILGMRQIPGHFFPLFQEEAWLLDRLGFLFQTFGKEQEAERCFKEAKRFKTLPRQNDDKERIRAFLDEHKPEGDVLQIGGDDTVSAAIDSYGPKSHAIFSWNRISEAIGQFDRIYLFFPSGCFVKKAKKPQLVSEIEAQFPILDSIVYSDADIDLLLDSLSPEEKEHALHFFTELERKGHITAEQLDRATQRLGLSREIGFPEQEGQVFSILKRCLDRHWKRGALLRCYLQDGCSLYDDPKVFDEMIVDPNLHIEEKQEPSSRAIWATVQNL